MNSGWLRLLGPLVLGLLSAGCVTSRATPVLPTPTLSTAIITATPSTTATDTPTSTATDAPTPAMFYEAAKNAEGGHGGPPLLRLPDDVVVEYRVSGTCTFELMFVTPAGHDTAPSLRLVVPGAVMKGTWEDATIVPGSYYPSISEAVGCTYEVTIRAPG